MNRYDVRVIEGGRGLRFLDKTAQAVLVISKLRWQQLQRHFAIELRITCEIDLTHSAFSERSDDLIVSHAFAPRLAQAADSRLIPQRPAKAGASIKLSGRSCAAIRDSTAAASSGLEFRTRARKLARSCGSRLDGFVKEFLQLLHILGRLHTFMRQARVAAMLEQNSNNVPSWRVTSSLPAQSPRSSGLRKNAVR